MQGTRVWALVREDPTCRGAAKPVSHYYRGCALDPASHNYWAHVQQQRPNAAKNKLNKFIKKKNEITIFNFKKFNKILFCNNSIFTEKLQIYNKEFSHILHPCFP